MIGNTPIRCTCMLLLGLSVASTVGCGATLHIKTIRLGQATPDVRDPAGAARSSLLQLSQAATVIYELQHKSLKTSGGLTGLVEKQRDFFKDLGAKLANPDEWFSIDELVKKGAECRKKLGDLLTLDQTAVTKMMKDLLPGAKDAEVAAAIRDLHNVQMVADRAKRLVDAAAKDGYGGYQSSSVYIINPGDADWERAKAMPRVGALVFSRVATLATNDATVMVIQESPGQFEPRYISSDPEQAIRNGLVVTNRMLRLVAQVAPLIGLPLGVGGGGASSGSPSADTAVTEEVAEEVMNSLDESISNLLADDATKGLLEKVKAGTALTEPEKAQMRAKLAQLRALLGITKKDVEN